VFIGHTEVVHNEESRRVSAGFHYSGTAAEFTVENPVIGLNYAVAWMPPPAEGSGA